MTAAIEIEGLTREFPVGIRGMKLRAIDDLSLSVPDNQVFGLLGPNGSGKTTTIKVIMGLLRPSAGGCRVFGASSHLISTRARIGFLPESPYFYRYLSGRELVRHYARLCSMPRARIAERTDEVLSMVGMGAAGDRRVGTYSKGMLQRIGLAQAIVHDPQLVILDEPTAGVDPLGAVAIAGIVRQLKQQGKTVLLSSHLLTQVEDLCDAVAILDRGRLVCSGRLEELVVRDDADTLEVDALDDAGRAAVERALAAHGSRLRRTSKPRLPLSELFLKHVGTEGRGAGDEGQGGPRDEP